MKWLYAFLIATLIILGAKAEKLRLKEEAKMTKEMEAMDKAKAKEEAKNKKKIEWKDPR